MARKPTFPKRTFKHKLPDGTEYQVGDGGAHFTDPERLRKAVEDQAQWAEGAQSPFTRLTPQMSIVNRARREITDWHEGLQQVELALAVAKRNEKKALNARRVHFAGLLAECFAVLGQYDNAIAVSPKGYTTQKKEWRAHQKAITNTNGCDCSIENHPFLASKERVHGQIFNPETGQMQTIIACNVCNDLSVKAPSPELVKQREARARAAGLANGKTHAAAHRDLTSAGLTSERLFSLRQ